jgi:hypothetical protein
MQPTTKIRNVPTDSSSMRGVWLLLSAIASTAALMALVVLVLSSVIDGNGVTDSVAEQWTSANAVLAAIVLPRP